MTAQVLSGAALSQEVCRTCHLVCVCVLHLQEKYACALKRAGISIVTPDWVLDCISEKAKKDEALYHPRLIIYEEEEEEEEEEVENEEQDSANEASSDEKSSPASSQGGSPAGDPQFSPKANAEKAKGELMFDDSSDSSPEKQERNLNWTPAEVPPLTAAKRRLPPGKEPGLINLCANVPPVPGGVLPPEVRGNLVAPGQALPGSERPEAMAAWSPAVRTLRNITNSADIQQMSRPPNVAHVSPSERTGGPAVGARRASASRGVRRRLTAATSAAVSVCTRTGVTPCTYACTCARTYSRVVTSAEEGDNRHTGGALTAELALGHR